MRDLRDLQYQLEDFRVLNVLRSNRKHCLELIRIHPQCRDLLERAVEQIDQTINDSQADD